MIRRVKAVVRRRPDHIDCIDDQLLYGPCNQSITSGPRGRQEDYLKHDTACLSRASRPVGHPHNGDGEASVQEVFAISQGKDRSEIRANVRLGDQSSFPAAHSLPGFGQVGCEYTVPTRRTPCVMASQSYAVNLIPEKCFTARD